MYFMYLCQARQYFLGFGSNEMNEANAAWCTKPQEAWLTDCVTVALSLLGQTPNCRSVMEGCAGHVLFKGIQPKGKEGLKSRLCYCTLLTMKPGTGLCLSGRRDTCCLICTVPLCGLVEVLGRTR